MRKVVLAIFGCVALLGFVGQLTAANLEIVAGAQQTCSLAQIPANSKAIKMVVTTENSYYGPRSETHFKEGDGIVAVVYMTNTGDHPVCVCSSSPLYQNRPQLLKDGKPVPYIAERLEWIEKFWESEEPCQTVTRVPVLIELKPKVPTKVGWFIVSEGKHPTGNITWFKPLPVGHYQLILTRKLRCCAGQEVTSAPFDFEVVADEVKMN